MKTEPVTISKIHDAATILWPVSMNRSKKTETIDLPTPAGENIGRTEPPSLTESESTIDLANLESEDPPPGFAACCRFSSRFTYLRLPSRFSASSNLQKLTSPFFRSSHPIFGSPILVLKIGPSTWLTPSLTNNRTDFRFFARVPKSNGRPLNRRAGRAWGNPIATHAGWARWLALRRAKQPGLVATLLLPRLQELTAIDPTRPIRRVRIIRLPTELTTVADDAKRPPYLAAVTRRDRSN